MTRSPGVEFLWWAGCPSHPEALAILRAEMGSLGLDPASVEVREIVTHAEAETEAFIGSPTIRIDGVDVVETAGRPPSLACRVYRLRDGRISAIPDREDLRAALNKSTGKQGSQPDE